MPQYTDGFVSTRGLRFHYLDWGDPAAPPIVLLHGTTSNAHSWDKLCPMLTPKYRCISFDWLNHGDSSPQEIGGLWDQQSNDLLPLVDQLGLDVFGLIGLSMGGRAAMAFAAKWPERVNRLVVEDMAPHITEIGREGAIRFQRNSALEFDTWDDLKVWVRKARPFAPEEWIEEVAQASYSELPDGRFGVKYRNSPQVANPNDLETAERLWNMLPNVAAPTLLLRGGKSRILDDEICDRMCATIPDCRVETIPQAGHMIHEDNPAVALPLIAGFYGV